MPGNADRANKRLKNKTKKLASSAYNDREESIEANVCGDFSVEDGSLKEQQNEEKRDAESFIEETATEESLEAEKLIEGRKFDDSVEKIALLKELECEEIRKLYSAYFSKSGFGGGMQSIIFDFECYLADKIRGLCTDGASRLLCEKLVSSAILRDAGDRIQENNKNKLPLAVKITVALDIHSGSRHSAKLCGTVYEIFKEAASLISGDELRAKELIGELLSFVVGQGINT